jgi:arsenate reductase
MKKQRVLFLCTGNSCRSQLAEAIANARCAAHWEAFSAGIRPAEAVHPLVPRVLTEAGITFKGKPKSPESLRYKTFDLVFTLCDSAKEECPVWLGAGERIHRDYADPGALEGPPEEQAAAFRKLRDTMLADIPYVLEKYSLRKLE